MAKVCQTWSRIADDDQLRKVMRVTMNKNNFRYFDEITLDIKDSVNKKKTVKHIEFKSILDNPETDRTCSRIAAEDKFFDQVFNEIIPYSKNIQKLHMEACADSSFYSISIFGLFEHPSLVSVTLIHHGKPRSSEKNDFHVKIVMAHKTFNLNCKNLSASAWIFSILSCSYDDAKFSSSVTVFETFDNLDRKNEDSCTFFMNVDDFTRLCDKCSKLERLVINISEVITLEEFSNILKLKYLTSLEVVMKYTFAQRELVKVFEECDIKSQLKVEIFQIESSRKRQKWTAKNGLITISFLGRRRKE